MTVRYDSRQTVYKEPFGCLRPGEDCRITVREVGAEPQGVDLVIEADGGERRRFPMKRKEGPGEQADWEVWFRLPDCGLYFYYFQLGPDRRLMKDPDNEPVFQAGEPWQLSVCPAELFQETSWDGQVLYQIFPDRFCRAGSCDLTGKLSPYTLHETFDAPAGPEGLIMLGNDQFFGGNFAGIQEKLPFLRALGVGAIYLNPICMAQSSHRYDTADYLRPDPMLGTLEDFRLLCRAAHSLGLRVILDGVFSHTGSVSRYFDQTGVFGGGAASDPTSPCRSWYTFQHWPEAYTAWWGIPTLPCLNELDPAVLEFLVTGDQSVVRRWLRLGADGFRLDVADELPDEFLRALHRVVLEEKPRALILGEVWEDASNKISYGVRRTYFTALELDGVMNYPARSVIVDFLLGKISAGAVARQLMTLAENYPGSVLRRCSVSLSTHDTPRVLSVFLENQQDGALDRAIRLEQLAVLLQFSLPGMPCVYYGDEAGMQGGADPDNRRPYPWGREDRRLLDWYRALGRLRQTYPALRTGDFSCGAASETLLWLRRRRKDQTLLLLIHTGAVSVSVPVAGGTCLAELGARVLTEAAVLEPMGGLLLLT